MLRALAISLAALAVTTAVVPAQGCVYLPVQEFCIDGPCRRPASQQEQRAAAWQNWLVEQRQFRREADARVNLPDTDHAADLARTLIPLVRAQFAEISSCGTEPEESDNAGYLTREDIGAWLREQIDPALLAQFNRLPGWMRREIDLPSTVELNRDCNIEYRQYVATELAKRVSPDVLRHVWLNLARRGFLINHQENQGFWPRQQAIARWSGQDRSTPIVVHAVQAWDYRFPQRIRLQQQSSRRILRYFQHDSAAITLLSAIGTITDARAPTMTDATVCPRAAAESTKDIEEFGVQLAAATTEMVRQHPH